MMDAEMYGMIPHREDVRRTRGCRRRRCETNPSTCLYAAWMPLWPSFSASFDPGRSSAAHVAA